MYAQIILRSGKSSGRRLKMEHRRILLGSGEDCTLRIRARGVATHHCTLYVSGGVLAVRNLSRQGTTYVCDRPIEGVQPLQPGDLLRVGPLTFEVQFDPAELARTVPAVVPQEHDMGHRPADSDPARDCSDRPQQPAAHVVGVCKSREWIACPSPSDAAAGAIKWLSRRG